ncbi:MAG: hypothetical protein IKZ86_11710 [Spirochaetaceae bacterium]|nr:hypothetical protein [Spirochaetaceae bacterium]
MEEKLIEEVEGKKYTYKIILVSEFPVELKVVCKENGKILPVKVSEEQIMKWIFSGSISQEEFEVVYSEANDETVSQAVSNEILNAAIGVIKSYIHLGRYDRIIELCIAKK